LDKEMLVELVPAVPVVEAAEVLALLEPQTQVVQLVVLGCNGQMEPIMPGAVPEQIMDLLPAAELAVVDLVLVVLGPLMVQQILAAVAAPTGHFPMVLKQEAVDQE
jgi:hypothetical protein